MTKQISDDVKVALDDMKVAPAQGSHELSVVLSKLATDDDFRERLLSNPVAALAGLGITIDPALVPAQRTLPSKGSIVTDHSVLRKRLETTNNMVIFLLSGNG